MLPARFPIFPLAHIQRYCIKQNSHFISIFLFNRSCPFLNNDFGTSGDHNKNHFKALAKKLDAEHELPINLRWFTTKGLFTKMIEYLLLRHLPCGSSYQRNMKWFLGGTPTIEKCLGHYNIISAPSSQARYEVSSAPCPLVFGFL